MRITLENAEEIHTRLDSVYTRGFRFTLLQPFCDTALAKATSSTEAACAATSLSNGSHQLMNQLMITEYYRAERNCTHLQKRQSR